MRLNALPSSGQDRNRRSASASCLTRQDFGCFWQQDVNNHEGKVVGSGGGAGGSKAVVAALYVVGITLNGR